MKKTVTINLNGLVFYIDEDAYNRLHAYLEKLTNWFRKKEGAEEIITDIETRIAELFEEKVKPGVGVVTLPMVEEVIKIMGEPEEFEDTDAGYEKKTTGNTYFKAPKRLYRDIDDRVFGGVCSGIAAYFNIDVVLVRVIFAILPFVSVGVIIPIYIVLWIAVPPAVTTAQKLQMRGEPINISNIEKTIKEEYEDVKKRFSKIKDSDTYKKGKDFFSSMTNRDKTVMIVVLALLGAALMLGSGYHIPTSPVGIFNVANISMVTHPGMVMPQIYIPNILKVILVIALIGLLIKPLFKVVLYLILLILAAVVLFPVLLWIIGLFAIIF
jgi:phage shock protein PspC (stress-responsive transcriptional regulator)